MKFDRVRHWVGGELPIQYRPAIPHTVSGEELLELSKFYDVAIMHHKQPQPTKKAIKKGAEPVPDYLILWFDDKGSNFRQR